MSKSVMISIKPRWCELIASGKKTVEVRKTRPKLETPFKCYIYETKGKTEYPTFIDEEGHEIFEGRGQVIGEFICDAIYSMWAGYTANNGNDCLTFDERETYLGSNMGYGWHISDLKIYDKPKDLSEFQRACTHNEDCGSCKRWNAKKYDCIADITRPPQSWCYVESL